MKSNGAGALVACLAGLAIPATAAAASATVKCGSMITQNTTLASDVGPCNQGGIVIGADNITLDLGGHSVLGKPRNGDGIGISTNGHSRVTIENGIVRFFDTGVGVMGGADNTVTGVTARDNIGTDQFNSKFGRGDGILIYQSNSNSVYGNKSFNNGPFAGITVLGDASSPSVPSAHNAIIDNTVTNNDIPHQSVNEDDGIRIEGPNATGTLIDGNDVEANGLDGISIFADQLTGFKNSGSIITNNTVTGNGFNNEAHRKGDGLILFGSPTNAAVGGADGTTVSGNTVEDNAANGIRVLSEGNTISSNTALYNDAYPNVTAFDLVDAWPACDSNSWSGDTFGTHNQACVS